MMTQRDRQTLEMLLTELITAQDNVTHLNEKGEQFEGQTRNAIEIRTGIRRRIIAFCDEITSVTITQVQADALYFLSNWALRQELPPLSVIGAADCVFHIAKRTGFEWSTKKDQED